MVALASRAYSVAAPAATPFGGAAKRAMDLLIAAPAVLILTPVLMLLGLAVKIQDGGPMLFVQPRVGWAGRAFRFLKFRTMDTDAGERLRRMLEEDSEAAREWCEKQKLNHDPRVTPLGRFLRRTSLDELPQLINVLAGHMSVVGPRPILPEQAELYGGGFELYCRARPGLTGLWQVSGRADTGFGQRAKLDETYLRAWSPLTDLALIVRTFGAVLSQNGAC